MTAGSGGEVVCEGSNNKLIPQPGRVATWRVQAQGSRSPSGAEQSLLLTMSAFRGAGRGPGPLGCLLSILLSYLCPSLCMLLTALGLEPLGLRWREPEPE